MARLTLHGKALYTEGSVPVVGAEAPAFRLTDCALVDVDLRQLGARCKVISVVPSIEPPQFQEAARRLDGLHRRYPDCLLLLIAPDLPFALQRVCEANALIHVMALSSFRHPTFTRTYGLEILGGPLRGLSARALFVLDQANRVRHAELVRELSEEPDHEALLHLLDSLAAVAGPVTSAP